MPSPRLSSAAPHWLMDNIPPHPGLLNILSYGEYLIKTQLSDKTKGDIYLISSIEISSQYSPEVIRKLEDQHTAPIKGNSLTSFTPNILVACWSQIQNSLTNPLLEVLQDKPCNFGWIIFQSILTMKYIISTALMREKPVRSPMVPPIADSWSTNLAARSCRVRRLRRS